jgi:hypothetical protein
MSQKELDRLATITGDLEKRVRHLENIAWVLGTLAVAFGLSGAAIWKQLNETRSTLAAMSDTASQITAKVAALANRTAAAEASLGKIEPLVADADGAVKRALARAEPIAESNLVTYVRAQRASLLAGVLHDGDAISLQFRSSGVYLGATEGHGTVNTGTQEVDSERLDASDDDILVIAKRPPSPRSPWLGEGLDRGLWTGTIVNATIRTRTPVSLQFLRHAAHALGVMVTVAGNPPKKYKVVVGDRNISFTSGPGNITLWTLKRAGRTLSATLTQDGHVTANIDDLKLASSGK